jgi:hypothetical protein
MINYSSYNDAWGISPRTEHLKSNEKFNNIKDNNNKKNIIKKNNTKISNESNKCIDFDHILNCDKCLEKLKKKLNKNNKIKIKETFENNQVSFRIFLKNTFEIINTKIKDFLLIFCTNKKSKKIFLVILIILFIVFSFVFVKDRGVESSDKNIEDLSEAIFEAQSNIKYLKENFIMIPKNLVNFTPNL